MNFRTHTCTHIYTLAHTQTHASIPHRYAHVHSLASTTTLILSRSKKLSVVGSALNGSEQKMNIEKTEKKATNQVTASLWCLCGRVGLAGSFACLVM